MSKKDFILRTKNFYTKRIANKDLATIETIKQRIINLFNIAQLLPEYPERGLGG
jgi:hypothetical protein